MIHSTSEKDFIWRIRMPYALRPLPTGQYEVINKESRKIHARHTTKAKAEAQIRLLNAIEHGFTPRKA